MNYALIGEYTVKNLCESYNYYPTMDADWVTNLSIIPKH